MGKARAFTKRGKNAPAIGVVGDRNKHRIPRGPALNIGTGGLPGGQPNKHRKQKPGKADRSSVGK